MATLNADQRLFDMLTRQQVYVAGVALQLASESVYDIDAVIDNAIQVVERSEYDTLDAGSKTAFLALLGQVIAFMRRRMDAGTVKRMKQLEQLTAIERRMVAIIMVTDSEEKTEPVSAEYADEKLKESKETPVGGILLATTAARLWASMLTDIYGPGVTLASLVDGPGIAAEQRLVNILRQAYANGWTKTEIRFQLERLRGRLRVDAMSAATTQTSAVTQRVQEVVQSAFPRVIRPNIEQRIAEAINATTGRGLYMWISVLDSRTTDICRSRSRRIYEYGRGPVPPAHYRCRSHIVPYRGQDIPETYGEWLSQQPANFIRSVYTAPTARAVLAGTADRSITDRLNAERPLTLEGYESMLANIMLFDE